MSHWITTAFVFFVSLPSYAGTTALSFNGNLSGTSSITSLILTIYSGSCNLYVTQDYGAVPMDAAGNFSVNIDGTSGTYLGNSGGTSYTSLEQIFGANPMIFGQSGCSIDGTNASWAIAVNVNGTQLTGAVPINAVPFAIRAETAVNAQKIAGIPVSTTPPLANQVLQYTSGSWVPTTPSSSGGSVLSVSGTSPLFSSGGTSPTISLAGLTSLGTADQLLGMNSAGTGFEYKSLNAGPGLSISQSSNSTTISASGELAGLSTLTSTGYVKRTGTGAYSTSASLTVALASDVTGTLPIVSGGTNSSTALVGSRVMVSSPSAIIEGDLLTPNTIMRTNAAGLPTTGAVNLTTEVTGALAIANGGTGSTTGSIAGNSALNFAAGGTNQNITLSPSGTGSTVITSNVGIGTSAPAGKLHIYQGANAKTELNLGVLGTGSVEAANLNLITLAGGGTKTLGQTGTKGFQVGATGNTNTTSNQFNLRFWDGASWTDIFSVNQAYTVINAPTKIGYYEPATYSASGAQPLPNGHSVVIDNYAGPGTAAMNVYSVDGTQSAYIGAAHQPTGNTPAIVIGQQTSGSSYAERMRIDPSGNVGIGTTAPKATLDVNGSIRSRVSYQSCPLGCSNVALSLMGANHFVVNVGSGSVGLDTSNSSIFTAFEGTEFSFTVCSTSLNNISVSFNGHTSGFSSGVTWSPVSGNTCTTQKFVVMNKSGYYAFPVSPSISYAP